MTDTPWKLNNLTAEDKITAEAVMGENGIFTGLSIEVISDDFAVEIKNRVYAHLCLLVCPQRAISLGHKRIMKKGEAFKHHLEREIRGLS